jgi:hypothetical protein
MHSNALVAAVEAEIATLHEVKRLLSGEGHKRGRKPGVATAFTFGSTKNAQEARYECSGAGKDPCSTEEALGCLAQDASEEVRSQLVSKPAV